VRAVEIAVVGGGPAGAATACGLAASGQEVVLIERTAGPQHKVCGEFISGETRAYLARLGVEPSNLGAVDIDRLSIMAASRRAVVRLPFSACSLSRLRLDEAILKRAEDHGAVLWRGTRVLSAAKEKTRWVLYCSGGRSLRCKELVVATGKSALRGINDARDRSLVGLKIHLQPSGTATRELAGQVQLFLVDEGYVGLELVEGGIANLCLVLPASTVAQIGPGWASLRRYLALCNPFLAQRLETLLPLWERPLAIVCPRAGYIGKTRLSLNNSFYPVGDRLAHIPPFTGDGLAIALSSAALAVEHLCRDLAPRAYLYRAIRSTKPALRVATLLSRVAAGSKGQSMVMRTASRAPGLIRVLARHTRMPLAALNPEMPLERRPQN
jgi:flavin-dependent dehydrogenase